MKCKCLKYIKKERKKECTIAARTSEIANAELPAPSCKATATERAATVAECDDGIPPDPRSRLESHLFSLYLQLNNWSEPSRNKWRNWWFGHQPCGEELEELSDGKGEASGDEREVGGDSRWSDGGGGSGILSCENLVHEQDSGTERYVGIFGIGKKKSFLSSRVSLPFSRIYLGFSQLGTC